MGIVPKVRYKNDYPICNIKLKMRKNREHSVRLYISFNIIIMAVFILETHYPSGRIMLPLV